MDDNPNIFYHLKYQVDYIQPKVGQKCTATV